MLYCEAMTHKPFLLINLAVLALVLACGGSEPTPTPTPTTSAPAVVSTAVVAPTPTDTPTSTAIPISTATPSPIQEWNLERVHVDGSTVTVLLRVYAGIDVRVTLNGRDPDEVKGPPPVIQYVFQDIAPGEYTVHVLDVVGYSQTGQVVVPTPIATPLPTPSPTTSPTPEPAPAPKAVDETNFQLTLPDGFRISLFTQSSLGPIRFMAFSPDGILFASMPSPTGLYTRNRTGGKIFALPDLDQDGKADEARAVLTGLDNLPHGLAFHEGYLYVAQEHRISRYPYLNDGNLGEPEVVVENLPVGASHISRTVGFNSAGKMYVSVGSSCNVCEEQDKRRAAILEFNSDGSEGRVFAEGIRNAVGFVIHPVTQELWATENGRDRLGEDLPPDEIIIVQEGNHYGWPYCYGQKIPDPKYNNAGLCATTIPSAHDMQAHSAPLGLRFIESSQFPEEWQGDLLVAYHGSTGRRELTGYKVVRLDVEGDKIVGEEDFVSGWLKQDESVVGRPVDLIFDSDGALYISDDRTGLIYRVTKIEY